MKKVYVLFLLAAAGVMMLLSCTTSEQAQESPSSSYAESEPKVVRNQDKEIVSAPKAEESGSDDMKPMEEEEVMSEPEVSAAKPEAKKHLELPALEDGETSAGRDEESRETLPVETALFLSADDSNSAASPVIVRKMIRSGKYVQPAVVRTYEFLNYYSFTYAPAREGGIELYPSMRPMEEEGVYSLQVALRSEDRTIEGMKPFNITFLLDTSGSMAGESLKLAKSFISAFTERLIPGSLISIVTCSSDARVLLQSHKTGPGTANLLDRVVFPEIQADNVTNLEKGIEAAYQVAGGTYNSRYINRVVLISDGAANAGDLAGDIIAEYAGDNDRQGIYLAGVGLGQGFNDRLMDEFTDRGRGAYLFLDSEEEIDRVLQEGSLPAYFDIAAKDILLKMTMPEGWAMREFHGEQVSAVEKEVIPQYLSPNDQMIYHMELTASQPEDGEQTFSFEARFTPLGGRKQTESVTISVGEMLAWNENMVKGDAVVAYAEMLKKIAYPLSVNRTENLKELNRSFVSIQEINSRLHDPELDEILALIREYRITVTAGERFPGSMDAQNESPSAILGIPKETVLSESISGAAPDVAVRGLERLLDSVRVVPQEGYRFLALSSGSVGNTDPAGAGELSGKEFRDPSPEYMGYRKISRSRMGVYDLHTVELRLKAPSRAKSFSFDFNFFSAEYPEYVNQNFNDTFYAVIQAVSTNRGKRTNISFDSESNPIEVDSNYFQNPFHPIPNTGTGFDRHGSTGWLRTNWPIQGGEEFTLTFSIHDEGDAIYDSLVLIDNFRWNDFEGASVTDPLN